MNERIKKLAEQAGFAKEFAISGLWLADDEELERFAQLVRDDEREACAALVEADGQVHPKALAAARELKALAQPEREWVGLTDEEIDQIAAEVCFGYIDVARAIEAKLKEKNI